MTNSAVPLIGDSDVAIRRPSTAETRACRMLLPEAFSNLIPADLFVAIREPPLRFLGATACALFKSGDQLVWRVWMHVVKTQRRQGIGSDLLSAVISAAQHRRISALEIGHSDKEAPDALAFLEHQGFRLRSRVTTFEANVEAFARFLFPLRDRLIARNSLPENAHIVPLADAPFDQVVRLHAAHIGNTRAAFYMRSPQEVKSELENVASRALMVGDQVRGILLVQIDGDIARVHARIVAPTLRGRWANAVLMSKGLEGMIAQGAQRVHFVSLDTNRDTLKLAARTDAQIVERQEIHQLSLTAPAR